VIRQQSRLIIKQMERLHKITPKTREEITAQIKEFLLTRDEVEAAYLVGSFLNESGFRDIDVCLLPKEGIPKEDAFRLSLKLSWELEKAVSYKGVEFDVRMLPDTPLYFQYEVLKTGKLLFSRDPQRLADYQADVVSRYLDYKPVLDFFNRKLLEDV